MRLTHLIKFRAAATIHAIQVGAADGILNLSIRHRLRGPAPFFSFLAVWFTAIAAPAQSTLPSTNFAVLTHEHVDGPCVIYNPSVSPSLSLIAWQRDAGLDLPTNQFIMIVSEQAKLTLPAGTPFGDAGQPFWILPQSQNPSLLYLGINVDRVPNGIFSGPIAIRLTRFEGPGYLMAWQATGPGQYNVRINTRDGIGPEDAFVPLVGAHEHFNWGFSSTGVFCATFQAVGQRVGESTNITSPESTFLFQVLPLPPATNYSIWQKHFWPPGFNPPTALTNGNPDGDAFTNLLDYAFALSPTNATPLTNTPRFEFVTTNDQTFGAFTFTRYKPALDLVYEAQVSPALPGNWVTITNVHDVVPGTNGLTEQVTMRDSAAATTNTQRFFRLKTELLGP